MDRHVPLVYAIACKKDKATYTTIMQQLKLAVPNLKPKTIMVDFEKAAIDAAAQVFPNADINGCFFHFCQCIYRQIQANYVPK